mgnify:CR=1 FL=1
MIDLENKNIILTGATGGIGSSIVEILVSLNAKVLITGTNQKKLEELENKFKNIIAINQDISSHNELEEFINQCNLKLNNKIDILINNAGITKDNLTIRMDKNEWDKVIDINLTSTFLLSKFVYLSYLVSSVIITYKASLSKLEGVFYHPIHFYFT